MKKKVIKKSQPRIHHEIQTEYLGDVYSKQFLKLVPRAVKKLRSLKKKYHFDAIAFSGSSGAALAYPLSYLLKMPLIHVRKGSSHYGSGRIEGTISSKRFIIIDDFIETGGTIKRIIREVKKEMNEAKPVVICLYSSTSNSSFNDIPIFTIPKR